MVPPRAKMACCRRWHSGEYSLLARADMQSWRRGSAGWIEWRQRRALISIWPIFSSSGRMVGRPTVVHPRGMHEGPGALLSLRYRCGLADGALESEMIPSRPSRAWTGHLSWGHSGWESGFVGVQAGTSGEGPVGKLTRRGLRRGSERVDKRIEPPGEAGGPVIFEDFWFTGCWSERAPC